VSIDSHAEAIAYIDAHAGRGVKPGLDRIHGLLDMMAQPHRGYGVVHVAGTNGKTSTTRFVGALLAAHGLTVGSFISPHLQHLEERFMLNNEPMQPDELAAAVADVAPLADLYEERSGDLVTYFELTTAIAFGWFAEKAVDVAVVEVGLGGRLDSTNVFDDAVAVLTSMGIDHTDYLGGTIAEIAAEKVAILKPAGSLVTGPLPTEAEKMVAGRVADTGSPWHRLGAEFRLVEAEMAVGGWNLEIEGIYDSYEDIFLAMHGSHQTRNFTVAVAAAEVLTGRALDIAAVREAAATVELPGRFEILGREPLVVVDGAHNPAGFDALATTIAEEFPPRDWQLVIGAMGDKDIGAMLAAIEGQVAAVYTVAVDHERAISASSLAELAAAALGVPATARGTVADGIAAAKAAAGGNGAVLVAGSLYVAGEARSALRPDG